MGAVQTCCAADGVPASQKDVLDKPIGTPATMSKDYSEDQLGEWLDSFGRADRKKFLKVPEVNPAMSETTYVGKVPEPSELARAREGMDDVVLDIGPGDSASVAPWPMATDEKLLREKKEMLEQAELEKTEAVEPAKLEAIAKLLEDLLAENQRLKKELAVADDQRNELDKRLWKTMSELTNANASYDVACYQWRKSKEEMEKLKEQHAQLNSQNAQDADQARKMRQSEARIERDDPSDSEPSEDESEVASLQSQAPAVVHFKAGDDIEYWSRRHQAWCRGTVLVARQPDGQTVIVKYTLPDSQTVEEQRLDGDDLLRYPARPMPPDYYAGSEKFKAGDKIVSWFAEQQSWCRGTVEAFVEGQAEDHLGDLVRVDCTSPDGEHLVKLVRTGHLLYFEITKIGDWMVYEATTIGLLYDHLPTQQLYRYPPQELLALFAQETGQEEIQKHRLGVVLEDIETPLLPEDEEADIQEPEHTCECEATWSLEPRDKDSKESGQSDTTDWIFPDPYPYPEVSVASVTHEFPMNLRIDSPRRREGVGDTADFQPQPSSGSMTPQAAYEQGKDISSEQQSASPAPSTHKFTADSVRNAIPFVPGDTPHKLKAMVFRKANKNFHKTMDKVIKENKEIVGKIEMPGNKKMPYAYVWVPKNHPRAEQITQQKIDEWNISSSQVIVPDGLDVRHFQETIDPKNKFGLDIKKTRDLPE